MKRLFRILRQPKVAVSLIVIVAAAVGGYSIYNYNASRDKGPEEISFTDLRKKVGNDEIGYLNIDHQRFTVSGGEKKDEPLFYAGIPNEGGRNGLDALTALANKKNVNVSASPVPEPETSLSTRISQVFTILLFAGIFGLIAYQLGIFTRPTKDQAKIPGDISFDDVAGCGEAIDELKEIKLFLQSPERYEQIGASPPRGVLLYGPPGTGKTLLAKAMAAEAGVPFLSISGSSFVEMFVGRGASRVRRLFKQARKVAPAIIFIDELDSVGGKRSGNPQSGGEREGDQTLLELLNQINGFESDNQGIVMIGATNRIEVLDPALTRPGRFDRHISVDPPDRKGRLDILKVHARDKNVDADLEPLAVHSAGMTGADLALIMNEAALSAVRRNSAAIKAADLDSAFMRVVAGAEKQNRAMTDREKRRVAVHEAGHALVREKLQGTDRVHRISIIPRGRSGGQTIMVSEEDVFLHTPQDIKDMITALLAGRAAEETVLGEVSSGASDDLQKTTELANQFVTHLGMSESMGLRVSDPGLISQSDLSKINSEIKTILDDSYTRATDLIREHRGVLDDVVDLLLEKETIERDEFIALLK